MLDIWTQILAGTFESLWLDVANIVPNLLVAIALLLLGWIVGAGVGKLVAQIISTLKVDSALRTAGVEKIVERSGYKLSAGGFLGALVKWFIIIVFLVAALDVLRLEQANMFLREVVLFYLPQVIVAVLILLIAALVADFVKNFVVASAKAAEVGSPYFLGSVAHWAIWIFAILAALDQLSVASAFIQTLFTGFIVAISLALGLSFGLGGKDAAARYIERVSSELSKKHHE